MNTIIGKIGMGAGGGALVSPLSRIAKVARGAALPLLIATSAALPALAVTWTDPSTGIEWTYNVISGEAEIYSDWHKSAIPATTTGAVAVPSTLGGYPVRRIENWAFYYCTNITSVTIPNSVTRIGNYAFKGCSAMSSVTIPSSVNELGA